METEGWSKDSDWTTFNAQQAGWISREVARLRLPKPAPPLFDLPTISTNLLSFEPDSK
jgi:hypothetical protein